MYARIMTTSPKIGIVQRSENFCGVLLVPSAYKIHKHFKFQRSFMILRRILVIIIQKRLRE